MSIKTKFNHYGIIGSFKLLISILITKILYKKVRLIRFPIDIRGSKGIDFGKNLTTGKNCRLEVHNSISDKKLIFGDSVQINDRVHIVAGEKIEIGNNVLMASNIFISDLNHGSYSSNKGTDSSPKEIPINRILSTNPVKIEDNVWIGDMVSILPGVKIGEGSIIGANSVVTKNIPKYSIAIGNPARVIKYFDFNENIWKKIKT